MAKIRVQTMVQYFLTKVWDAWTLPEHITKWNQASDDWHCPFASNDLKVGGIYHARMEAKDGSFGFDFKAVYNEIIPEQLITYAMEDGRVCSTFFRPSPFGVEITSVFDAEEMNPEELQQAGWQAILNSFKNYVENDFTS